MKKHKWVFTLLVVLVLAAGAVIFLACRVSLSDYALSLPSHTFVDREGFVWEVMGDPPGERECTVRCENSRTAPFWVRRGADPADDWGAGLETDAKLMLRSDGSLWEIVWDTGKTRMLRLVREGTS